VTRETRGPLQPEAERVLLLADLRRHQRQLHEWLMKRRDCALAITNHYVAIRKLKQRAKRLGISL